MSTALSTTQHYPTPLQSPDAPDWKQLLAQRVEAHRAKSGAQPPVSTPSFRVPSSGSRASSIARAVASRYAEQPTYSEIMAATLAEHAAQDAEAAEYAAVQANRAYSQQVHWEQEGDEEAAYADPQPELPLSAELAESRGPEENQGLLDQYGTPYPASGTAVMPKFADRSQEMRLHQSPKVAEPSLEELLASSVVEPRAYLPSKLIEFPRELVSTHKARPRLPDPPVPAIPNELTEQESSQLRIFEVQPEGTSQPEFVQQSGNSAAQEKKSEQPAPSIPPTIAPAKQAAESPVRATVSRMPSAIPNGSHGAIATKASSAISAHSGEADIPAVRTYKGLEWAAISLDKEPALYSRKRFATESDVAPSLIQPASIDRRVMAFAVDFSAVTGAFLGFLAVFAAVCPRIPSGLTGILLAGVVYAALWLLYQLMFFSLKGATAGMLYARIGLCTFNDQNPSRSALRRRLAAWWLSCLPLGLGFFWSFLDEDNLSWHDRMTGMYQRTY